MYEQKDKLGVRSAIPTTKTTAELDDRLVRCISSVLPTLTEEEIRAAEVGQLVEADSLTGVTLVALINEEFGVDLDLEGLLRLGNFKRVREHLLAEQVPTRTTWNRRRIE
jgi:acyl carrier protein